MSQVTIGNFTLIAGTPASGTDKELETLFQLLAGLLDRNNDDSDPLDMSDEDRLKARAMEILQNRAHGEQLAFISHVKAVHGDVEANSFLQYVSPEIHQAAYASLGLQRKQH